MENTESAGQNSGGNEVLFSLMKYSQLQIPKNNSNEIVEQQQIHGVHGNVDFFIEPMNVHKFYC